MHPYSSVGQVIEVYKLNVHHTTEETQKRRKKKLEEVEKRKQYRIAHGLQAPDPLPSKEIMGEDVDTLEGEGREYVDFERKKRHYKKWFGIW